jgi:hypothetical protein
MRKGFVITISAILLLTAVLLLDRSNQKMSKEHETAVIDSQAVDSAEYFFDDVADDLRNLLGPQVLIARNSSESSITFIEQLPLNTSSLLSNYSSFIAGYSQSVNAQASLDTSGILNGNLLVFSNGLGYYRNATAVKFYSPNGSTNSTAYALNISSNAYRTSENISSIPQSGAVKLTLHYMDLNGSIDLSGAFDPSAQSIYAVSYQGSSLTLRLGNISGSTDSLSVEQNGSIQLAFNLTARGGWNTSLGYAYNANLSYSQLNVNRTDLVWVEEG